MSDRIVYLGRPANGGIEASHAVAVERLITATLTRDMGFGLIAAPPLVGDSLVTRARNTVVDRFLRSPATDLLFIDADIDFQPEDVAALVDSGHDVVAGIYPRKAFNADRIRESVQLKRDPLAGASDPVLNWLAGHADKESGQARPMRNGCMEIGYAPTGFLLISRRVFYELAYEDPSLLHYADDGSDAPRFAFFQDPIVDDALTGQRRHLSEDWDFCRRVRALGGSIWAHLGVAIGHTGRHRYTWIPGHDLRVNEEPSEWCNPPDMLDDDYQKRLHLERYEWAASVLPDIAIANDGSEMRPLRVANAACGTNYGTPILAGRWRTVTGFDKGGEQARIGAERGYGVVVECDVEAFDFAGFDALACIETLEHLKEPRQFLERLAPSVRHLVLTTPIVPTRHANPHHLHDFTEAQLRAWLGELGWLIERVAYQDDPGWNGGTRDMCIFLYAVRA